MMQAIPIKQTRAQLADIIDQVESAGRSFVITRFGKPRAMLVPVSDRALVRKGKRVVPGFGLWAKRSGLGSGASWVAQQRNSWKKRSIKT